MGGLPARMTVIAAGALVLMALLAIPAAAKTRQCGRVTGGGKSWTVNQRQTNCTFARYAVRRFAGRWRSPRSWVCQRYFLSAKREGLADDYLLILCRRPLSTKRVWAKALA